MNSTCVCVCVCRGTLSRSHPSRPYWDSTIKRITWHLECTRKGACRGRREVSHSWQAFAYKTPCTSAWGKRCPTWESNFSKSQLLHFCAGCSHINSLVDSLSLNIRSSKFKLEQDWSGCSSWIIGFVMVTAALYTWELDTNHTWLAP